MTQTQMLLCAVCASALLSIAPAGAQMSITTFGATDAAACYQNAQDQFSTDTRPCDIALHSAATSRIDKTKTLVNRGIIHNRNGALNDALADFNQAIANNANLAEAYLNRGNTYFLGGRNDAAISDYERALALGVRKPWAAHYNIGLAYDAKKDADKARAAYEKALEINPSFTPAKTKLANRGQSAG